MGQDVRQAILDIIEDIAPDEDLENLDDDTPLRDQIELDSMDFLDIVLELRKRHGIEVPESDYPQLETMNSCITYLTPKFEEK